MTTSSSQILLKYTHFRKKSLDQTNARHLQNNYYTILYKLQYKYNNKNFVVGTLTYEKYSFVQRV